MDEITPQTPAPDALVADVWLQCPDLRGQHWSALRGGRSNHLWRVGDVVVKYFVPTAVSVLFPNDSLAEASALQAFAETGFAPELVAQGHSWVAYRYLDGETWHQDVQPVAHLLGRLHMMPAIHFFRESPDVAAQTRQILAQCQANLVLPDVPDLPKLRQNLHGDVVPGNIVCTATGAYLIDWQCPAIGDPIEDIAIFLSPAMQSLYRGNPLTSFEKRDFLAAYPNRETVVRYHKFAPLLHTRIAAHCLWKAERGNADYGAAFRLEIG